MTELKNLVGEMKISKEGFTSGVTVAEDRINVLKFEVQKITKQQQKKGKSLKINEKLTRELWDELKNTNIRAIGFLEGQEGNADEEAIVKDITVEKFPELEEARGDQLKETQIKIYQNTF